MLSFFKTFIVCLLLTASGKQLFLSVPAPGPRSLSTHCPLTQIPKLHAQPSLALFAGYWFVRPCSQAAAALSLTACKATLLQLLYSCGPQTTQPRSQLLLSPTTISSTPSEACKGPTDSHVVHSLPAVAAVFTVCRTGTTQDQQNASSEGAWAVADTDHRS
jgi:hypothetical protein